MNRPDFDSIFTNTGLNLAQTVQPCQGKHFWPKPVTFKEQSAPQVRSSTKARIQAYLRNHAVSTTGELAERLGVTRACIFENIRVMENANEVSRIRRSQKDHQWSLNA